MDEESKAKIIDNNKKISELLRETEKTIIDAGYNPPVNNFTLDDKNEKVKFPNGYIRINEIFQNKYHLNDIVKEKTLLKI